MAALAVAALAAAAAALVVAAVAAAPAGPGGQQEGGRRLLRHRRHGNGGSGAPALLGKGAMGADGGGAAAEARLLSSPMAESRYEQPLLHRWRAAAMAIPIPSPGAPAVTVRQGGQQIAPAGFTGTPSNPTGGQNGGSGASGASGGGGGTGGGGGGGSGGTVEVLGSAVYANSSSVDVGAGANGGNGGFYGYGQNGQFLYGSNTVSGSPAYDGVTSTGAPNVNFYGTPPLSDAGFTGINPYVSGSPSTPLIAGLENGAYTYGLVPPNSDLMQALENPGALTSAEANAPANAVAAVLRVPLNTGVMDASNGFFDDYSGYDLVEYVNLTNQTLADPQLGLNTGSSTNLQYLDPNGNIQTVAGLPAHGVWITLVPTGTATNVNATLTNLNNAVGVNAVMKSVTAALYNYQYHSRPPRTTSPCRGRPSKPDCPSRASRRWRSIRAIKTSTPSIRPRGSWSSATPAISRNARRSRSPAPMPCLRQPR